MNCVKCGKPLSTDEIGLYKKLLGRDAAEFFCIDCLSVYLDVSKTLLKEKTEQFRRSGCLLFTKPRD